MAAVLMILTVVGLFAFMICYEGSSSSSEMTMDYESTVFDRSDVIDINISMDEAQWEDLLENALSEEYYPCDISVNGTTYKNVGLRAKGNTSLSMVVSSDSDRYSFKISFDEYMSGQNLDGLSSLVLNNCYSDATMMKEAICYDMFSFLGADASLYNYAKISVNGQYWGVYLSLEPVDEDFAIRNYGLDHGQLYKPDSMKMEGPGKMRDFNVDSEGNAEAKLPEKAMTGEKSGKTFGGDGGLGGFGGFSGFSSGGGAELNYIDDDMDSYETIWDGSVFKSSGKDRSRVVTALKNICAEDVATETLEKYMDVDNVLRYMAVHTFVVNLDSLSSNMAHNYYLYEDDGKLNIIPWDYNLAFGGFQSGDTGETVNFPIDTPFSSSISMEDRQFFAALLENKEYLAKYHEYLRMLAEEYVGGGQFEKTVKNIRSSIDSLVEDDPTAFYTYDEYTAAVAMLIDTVKLRAESVLGQLDGSVPSTREGQTANPDALIDASSIDIPVMGSQGGENHGGFGDRPGEDTSGNGKMPDGGMPDFGEMPGGGQRPDMPS